MFLCLDLCKSCLFAFFNDLLINFVCLLKKELCEVVHRVLWYVFAEIDESLGQVRNNIVHEVLSNWL